MRSRLLKEIAATSQAIMAESKFALDIHPGPFYLIKKYFHRMRKYATKIDDREMIVEASSKTTALLHFHAMGHIVTASQVWPKDPMFSRRKERPNITMALRIPESAIADLQAMDIMSKSAQRAFIVKAVLEKIAQIKITHLPPDPPSQ